MTTLWNPEDTGYAGGPDYSLFDTSARLFFAVQFNITAASGLELIELGLSGTPYADTLWLGLHADNGSNYPVATALHDNSDAVAAFVDLSTNGAFLQQFQVIFAPPFPPPYGPAIGPGYYWIVAHLTSGVPRAGIVSTQESSHHATVNSLMGPDLAHLVSAQASVHPPNPLGEITVPNMQVQTGLRPGGSRSFATILG